MKYLALLRDSFREALDSKVMYFTFGLSGLLILLLLSVSFRPVTVKDEVELITGTLNWVTGMQRSGKLQKEPPRFELTHFEQLNEGAPPWEGNYRFTVTAHIPEHMANGGEGQENSHMLQMMLQSELKSLNNLQITGPTVSPDKRRIEFHATSQGTKVEDLRHWRHEPSLFFGLVPLSWFRSSLTGSVYFVENILVNNIGAWVIVLIAIIITAFFIPNMLQKGSVDLLLVKPVTRVELLLLKFLGGLTFIFVNSVVAIGGVWLVLGLRTGIWTFGFPLTMLVITFFFAILYSVSTLFGVLTRSAVLAIFAALLTWFALYVLGLVHTWVNTDLMTGRVVEVKEGEGAPTGRTVGESNPTLQGVAAVVNVLHAVLPRTSDLGQLSSELVSRDLLSDQEKRDYGLTRSPPVNLAASLGVSLAFITVMLGLACWRFATRDY